MEVRSSPPPPPRGISALLARYPMKTRQMGAIPFSAILSQKAIARYDGGGVSRAGPLSLCLGNGKVLLSAHTKRHKHKSADIGCVLRS